MAKKEKEIKTNAMRILEQKKIPYTVHTYDGEEFHDGVSVADMLPIIISSTHETIRFVSSFILSLIPIRNPPTVRQTNDWGLFTLI